MNNGWQYLILIFTMALSLSAAATNEYRQPVIYSQRTNASGRCRIIQIHSLTERNGSVFTQTGVGWIIQADEGYRILTPSHVISGADIIAGQCENSIFPLELQSRTETLDLALLRPLRDLQDIALPLIQLKKREEVKLHLKDRDREIFQVFNPDHFAKSFLRLLGQQEKNSYRTPYVDSNYSATTDFSTFDSEEMGIAHFESGLSSLVVEALAIRPGFSGAPFFITVQADSIPTNDSYLLMSPDSVMQYYLMGMLTKTEVNGSRSLGVSLPVILRTLPDLMKEQNSEVDIYAKSNNLPARLHYKNTIQNNSLQREQELIYTYRNGEQRTYTEICEDAAVDSSEWSQGVTFTKVLPDLIKDYKVKKDLKEKNRLFEDITRPDRGSFDKLKAVQQRTSGGDYGEGGGSAATLRNSRLMSPDPHALITREGNLTSYKRDHPCQKVLLKDNLGKTYDAMFVDGKIQKVTNLAEAYAVLSRGNALPERRSKEPLCPNLSLTMKNTSTTNYADTNGHSYIYERSEGVAVSASASKQEERFSGALSCTESKIRIQYKDESVQVNLSLGDPSSASGSIQFGNRCNVEINAKNYSVGNRWKHQIRTRQADVDINLGQEDRLLSIKILRLDPSCDNNQSQLWMKEINFSSEPSYERKNALENRMRSFKE